MLHKYTMNFSFRTQTLFKVLWQISCYIFRFEIVFVITTWNINFRFVYCEINEEAYGYVLCNIHNNDRNRKCFIRFSVISEIHKIVVAIISHIWTFVSMTFRTCALKKKLKIFNSKFTQFPSFSFKFSQYSASIESDF